jgi:hypothetical protein
MHLTALLVSDPTGWSILPSPTSRDWMDATPNRFAYRCLPLVIANQAGWTIPCPIGFRVRWNGDPSPNTTMGFEFDDQADRWKTWITSHFGSGIFTFSIPWLFRTDTPICLAVRGAPNTWKDGAAALEGIVETHWSPFTFTMNWKVTRPNEWIRFEKDEPICFLQPIDLGLIEESHPALKKIDADPATKAEFDEWNEARRGLIKDPNRGMNWQKNYFQGKAMSGAEAPMHKSKLTVRGFGPMT